MSSVFAQPKYQKSAYPYRYQATILVEHLVGGVPSDPKVAEGHIRSKIAGSDDLIRQMVAETMIERGIDAEQAAAEVARNRTLCGFKRDPDQGLYIEGRQVKAMLKEAACIAAAAGKLPMRGWGTTNKGVKGWIAEHVFVVEERVMVGRTVEDWINQRFVHTFRGSSVAYDEVVDGVTLTFTVISDHEFAEKDWAMIWLTAEQNGLGACRSQGFGTFEVAAWDRV